MNRLVEKLFLMLLAGAGSVGAYYLQKIDNSLTTIGTKMGALEATMTYTAEEISILRERIDGHEVRLDAILSHGGKK